VPQDRLVIEWADLLRDLDRLQEATIEKDGKPSPPALPSPAKSAASSRPPFAALKRGGPLSCRHRVACLPC
jgi:hypothetical protein